MKLPQESLVRAAVAAAALPVVGMVLWRGALWCAGLFAVAGAIAAYEYYRLTELKAARVRWVGIAAAAAVPALPLALPAHSPDAALAVVGGSSLITWTVLLIRGPRRDATRWAGLVIGGIVYISTGLGCLAVLRAHRDGVAWSAAVLIAAWANDTGAFFGGKLLGRHRLLPPVSPGKTWEGLAVGAVVGMVAMVWARTWLGALSLGDAVAIGAIAAVLGPIGDLCKSMMKRAAGTKDSGRLFLAHGGMLDRIDAILFDAPGVLAYVVVSMMRK
jgi:phosphatidate cytidylyltransferase